MAPEPCNRKRCPGHLQLWAWSGGTEFHICTHDQRHIVERESGTGPVDERQDALPGLEQGAEHP